MSGCKQHRQRDNAASAESLLRERVCVCIEGERETVTPRQSDSSQTLSLTEFEITRNSECDRNKRDLPTAVEVSGSRRESQLK